MSMKSRSVHELSLSEQIVEMNRRTGIPIDVLHNEPSSAIVDFLIDSSAHERLIEAEEAAGLLEADEMPRVLTFINADETRRSLLVGSVSSDEFVESFLVYDDPVSHPLLANGRSLRGVVETIREMGGLERAAALVPWLQKAVPLAQTIDFDRLTRRLIFVRRAAAEEAESSFCPGQGMYIEEGQHRAIAAAWNLTGGSAGRSATYDRTQPATIWYLRGVNLQGQERGHGFWDVGSPVARLLTRCSTVHCVCALIVCGVVRWMVQRPQRRRQELVRRRRELKDKIKRNQEQEVFLMGLHKRWL